MPNATARAVKVMYVGGLFETESVYLAKCLPGAAGRPSLKLNPATTSNDDGLIPLINHHKTIYTHEHVTLDLSYDDSNGVVGV